jgi:hypothetical protein
VRIIIEYNLFSFQGFGNIFANPPTVSPSLSKPLSFDLSSLVGTKLGNQLNSGSLQFPSTNGIHANQSIQNHQARRVKYDTPLGIKI